MKAHTGVEGNIIADAAAKSVVTQKIIDAGGNPNLIPDEDLEAAGIDDACEISNNAHEHHEWPVHPIPEQEGMDEKALLEMQGLLKEGTWPDGLRQDEHERIAATVAGCQATSAAALWKGPKDDKWHARNLIASLPRALRRSCRLVVCQAMAGCQTHDAAWRLTLVLGSVHKELKEDEDLHCQECAQAQTRNLLECKAVQVLPEALSKEGI